MTEHKHNVDFKNDFTVTACEDSQVTITGEIPYAELLAERPAAIKKLGKNAQLDGFRKGHIPEDIIVGRVGEMAILTEMAERTLAHFYPHIVEAHQLEVIGHPQVEITKLAPDNPLGFTATVAVLPEIKLPNYKQLAATVNDTKEAVTVTDEDIDKQVEIIQRQKMAYERMQQNAQKNTEPKEVEVNDLPTPESEEKKKEEEFDPETAPLPELTDEYVKGLGQPGQFEKVADFKAKLREHLEIEKKQQVDSTHRAKITDAIIAGSEMVLPKILIESEINQMLAQMQDDLTRANMTMDEYLAHIKKTAEELKTDWQPIAEKRAELQLILNEIAKVEKIEPDKAELDTQSEALLQQHKDADPMRVRVYVASILQNEAVLKMLEEQK